jgi:anthranilate phosphoribosyltransferase
MAELREMLERLMARENLSEAQASDLLIALTDPAMAPAMAGALLAALRSKGVTADEVRGFARAMRRIARRPAMSPDAAIDIVGTGGDSSGSVNVSTGSALLVAALGAPVVKHGNRSVSSRSGSADLLECLGLPIPLDENAAAECLRATGFTFLFAPHYHPAMKEVAPVRRALGVRTVFNLLGPLTNPAAPPFSLIGAYSSDAAQLIADTLAGMEIERAFVVHGEPGWDEPTPIGPFELFDVRAGRVRREVRDPRELGFERCAAADLAGGDAAHNAARLRAVFDREDRGAHRDALVLNAALALELMGRAPDAARGVELARACIDDGRARRLLDALAAFGRSRGSRPES